MSTCSRWKRENFWSGAPFDQEENPCSHFMEEFIYIRRFNDIPRELRFTNTNPPPYVDKFWQICQMVKAWNGHMTFIFLSSWSICIDNYMSIWNIRWTCPGCIFCPRNPHQFGNEWHTSFCAFSDVLFVFDLVEVNTHTLQAVSFEFEDLGGKTLVLLLSMMKRYFATGRYVILGYNFCVFKGLVQLRKNFTFPCAFIKNRRYWPSMVPCKEMEDYFGKVEVGQIDSIQGTVDDVIYNLWGMKAPNYVMRKMDTGGFLLVDDTCRKTARI